MTIPEWGLKVLLLAIIPVPHDISKTPRPTTLDFFFIGLFIKFGKQYQVNVGSPSAMLAERLVYFLGRGKILNICRHLIRCLDCHLSPTTAYIDIVPAQ